MNGIIATFGRNAHASAKYSDSHKVAHHRHIYKFRAYSHKNRKYADTIIGIHKYIATYKLINIHNKHIISINIWIYLYIELESTFVVSTFNNNMLRSFHRSHVEQTWTVKVHQPKYMWNPPNYPSIMLSAYVFLYYGVLHILISTDAYECIKVRSTSIVVL